jgi:pimeloyl-ACP methyl ester carboxylesterase
VFAEKHRWLKSIGLRVVLYVVVIGVGGFMGMPLIENQMLYYPEEEYIELPDALGTPYKDVWLNTSDGVRVHSWLIGETSHRPVVLFFHGNAGNISHRLHRLRGWKEFPVRVMMVDYRGYGQSEGKPSEEGLYLDAQAAYTYLRESEKLKAEEIIFFGESLGGAVAIDLASKHPAKALVVESTFTSLRELASKLFPFVPSMLVSKSYDSIKKISQLRLPTIIIHGTEDEIVPFEMGERLFEAAQEKKEFLSIKRAHHNDLYLLAGEEYFDLLKGSF